MMKSRDNTESEGLVAKILKDGSFEITSKEKENYALHIRPVNANDSDAPSKAVYRISVCLADSSGQENIHEFNIIYFTKNAIFSRGKKMPDETMQSIEYKSE